MQCPANKKYLDEKMTYTGVSYPKWPTYGFSTSLWNRGLAQASVKRPAEKYMCFDSNHAALGDRRAILTSSLCWQWSCGADVETTHAWLVPHGRGANLSYIDGHAEWKDGFHIYTNSWRLNPTSP